MAPKLTADIAGTVGTHDDLAHAFGIGKGKGLSGPVADALLRDLNDFMADPANRIANRTAADTARQGLIDHGTHAHAQAMQMVAFLYAKATPPYVLATTDIDVVTKLDSERIAERFFATGRATLAGGYGVDEPGKPGHLTMHTITRHEDGGAVFRTFNAGDGIIPLSEDPETSTWKPIAESKGPFRAALGRMAYLPPDATTLGNITDLFFQLTRDANRATVPPSELPGLADQRVLHAGGFHEPLDLPFDRTTSIQTGPNCTHKSLMNFLKVELDRGDYRRFKAFMRERRLRARADELGVAWDNRYDAKDETLKACLERHDAWAAKHKDDLAA